MLVTVNGLTVPLTDLRKDAALWACYLALQRANARVLTKKVRARRQVGVVPATFGYSIVLTDGRRWKQVVVFDELSDPCMTFDVTDSWRLSEFSLFRDVRDVFIALLSTNTVDDIVWDW